MQKKTLLVKKCVAAGFCSETVGLDRKLCILIKVQINPHPPIERIQRMRALCKKDISERRMVLGRSLSLQNIETREPSGHFKRAL